MRTQHSSKSRAAFFSGCFFFQSEAINKKKMYAAWGESFEGVQVAQLHREREQGAP
jgi:hypothetical protein